MIETVIDLDAVEFGRDQREFVRHGDISARSFRYGSGVAAVRIVTDDVEIDLLPYQGQQVWRASVHGRELAMRSMFDEPRPTRDYLGTYGALLIHCGVLAMGNPGPQDDHPLHGELPNAPYARPTLITGCDAAGAPTPSSPASMSTPARSATTTGRGRVSPFGRMGIDSASACRYAISVGDRCR